MDTKRFLLSAFAILLIAVAVNAYSIYGQTYTDYSHPAISIGDGKNTNLKNTTIGNGAAADIVCLQNCTGFNNQTGTNLSLSGNLIAKQIGNVTYASQFSTLQYAINNASNGGIVFVDANFTEKITGKNNLILRGDGVHVIKAPPAVNGPVVDFTGKNNSLIENLIVDCDGFIQSSVCTGIQISDGRNDTVQNNLILNASYHTGGSDSVGISVSKGTIPPMDNIVENNRIRDSLFGIYLSGLDYSTGKNEGYRNKILHNDVQGNNIAGDGHNAYYIAGCNQCLFDGNTGTALDIENGEDSIFSNIISDGQTAGESGILIGTLVPTTGGHNSNITISNFKINSPASHGITALSPSVLHNLIIQNGFISNASNGIQIALNPLQNVSTILISNVNIENSRDTGIIANDFGYTNTYSKPNISISNVKISGSANDGINIRDSNNTIISNSFITKNGNHGIKLQHTYKTLMTSNLITNNGAKSLYDYDGMNTSVYTNMLDSVEFANTASGSVISVNNIGSLITISGVTAANNYE